MRVMTLAPPIKSSVTKRTKQTSVTLKNSIIKRLCLTLFPRKSFRSLRTDFDKNNELYSKE